MCDWLHMYCACALISINRELVIGMYARCKVKNVRRHHTNDINTSKLYNGILQDMRCMPTTT